MFKDRALTVTMDKKDKDQAPRNPTNPKEFEKKAEFVLHKLERIGKKVFIGVCAYVVLDTVRQVAVAKTIYQTDEKE
jgi:hypothetical protein